MTLGVVSNLNIYNASLGDKDWVTETAASFSRLREKVPLA